MRSPGCPTRISVLGTGSRAKGVGDRVQRALWPFLGSVLEGVRHGVPGHRLPVLAPQDKGHGVG